MEFIKNFRKQIVDFIKRNLKAIIFIICFCVVCFVYNLNIQTLNFMFKKGVMLEYSLPQNSTISDKEIKDKLINLKIKYSYIEIENDSQEISYDKDNEIIDKSLYVALPYKITQKNKNLVDEVSNFVFEKCKNSKLVEISTMNEIYSNPYNSFLKFCAILLVSLFIWINILYLMYDYREINKKFKENIKKYLKKQKDALKNTFTKTKEQGILYLFKILLFDEKEENEGKINYTKEIICTIIFVIVAVIIIRLCLGELRWIPSGSMRPTILEHDRVFVEKLSLPKFMAKLNLPKKEIKRGDILVFYPPETKLSKSPLALFSRYSGINCKDTAYIKRTIGLPNDKFEIKYDEVSNEYRVYINDVALDEPYISSKTSWTPCNNRMYCGPFIIPENNYFMMGDNRDNSQDSRFWGFLDGNRIIGRANFMFWPISRINKLKDNYFELNKEIKNNKIIKYSFIINRY